MERFDRIDFLCNNAGVVSGGRTWEIPLGEWNRVLSVNLWGAIHCIHSFVPLIVDNESGGHVVNVASVAAVTPVPGIAPYNVSKYGLLALSETLRVDLEAAGSSVGVTVVMPGRVATSLGSPSGEPDPDPGDEVAGAEAGVADGGRRGGPDHPRGGARPAVSLHARRPFGGRRGALLTDPRALTRRQRSARARTGSVRSRARVGRNRSSHERTACGDRDRWRIGDRARHQPAPRQRRARRGGPRS